MSSPAFEKTRSLGTDVDGMGRNLLIGHLIKISSMNNENTKIMHAIK